jgi:competence ComEA-like helix-hairpin-helix protein
VRLYSRAELKLLLALAAVGLVGLGVREWRTGFPVEAERLERFDQESPWPSSPATDPAVRAVPTAAGSSPDRPARMPVDQPRVDRPHPSSGGRQRDRDPPCDQHPEVGSPAPALTGPADANLHPVDVNHATVAELAQLPGLGPALARRIVDDRARLGRFDTPEALRRVPGMGPRKLDAIRTLIFAGAPDDGSTSLDAGLERSGVSASEVAGLEPLNEAPDEPPDASARADPVPDEP